MQTGSACRWRVFLRATTAMGLATLLPMIPLAVHADGDPPVLVPAAATTPAASAPAPAPEQPGIVATVSNVSASVSATVSATVLSAADLVLRSAQDITDQALDLIGVRYKFGGESPDNGLDCSGLVKYVFANVTGVMLPRSAREQAKVGEKVDVDELQPGDLVFFNTRRSAFSHVGIYLGDNSFIHAPRKRSNVQVANIDGKYWKKHFNGARRLLGIMPGMISIEAAKSLLQALPVAADAPEEK